MTGPSAMSTINRRPNLLHYGIGMDGAWDCTGSIGRHTHRWIPGMSNGHRWFSIWPLPPVIVAMRWDHDILGDNNCFCSCSWFYFKQSFLIRDSSIVVWFLLTFLDHHQTWKIFEDSRNYLEIAPPSMPQDRGAMTPLWNVAVKQNQDPSFSFFSQQQSHKIPSTCLRKSMPRLYHSF